jgi:hypothetical protein
MTGIPFLEKGGHGQLLFSFFLSFQDPKTNQIGRLGPGAIFNTVIRKMRFSNCFSFLSFGAELEFTPSN